MLWEGSILPFTCLWSSSKWLSGGQEWRNIPPLETTRKSAVHMRPGFPFVKVRGHSTKRPFVGSEETPWLWATSGGLLSGLDSGFKALGFFHLPWLPTWVVPRKENVRRDREAGMRNVEKQNISYWYTIDFLFLCDLILLILLYRVILSRGTISYGEMSLPLWNLGT